MTGSGLKRESTRFDQDEEDDEDKKKLEKLKQITAKRQFKKLGLTVLEVI